MVVCPDLALYHCNALISADDELIVTRELCTLFDQLATAEGDWVRPRQRLANAALLSFFKEESRAKREAEKAKKESSAAASSKTEAPPLPPRSGGSDKQDAPTTSSQEHQTQADDGVVSSKPELAEPHSVEQTEPQPVPSETASNVSSHTLADSQMEEAGAAVNVNSKPADADTDTPMTDAEVAPASASVLNEKDGSTTLTVTVESLAEKLDADNVGTEQNDFDEVMGNAFDHLECAFQLSRIGQEDIPDPIKETFYSTFVHCRKQDNKADMGISEESMRWIRILPAENGSIHIDKALDTELGPHHFGESEGLDFTAIKQPAPALHLYISRSISTESRSSKNSNPVEIEPVIYLDRFMPDQVLENDIKMKPGAQRYWDIHVRLAELEEVEASTIQKADSTSNANVAQPAERPNGPTVSQLDAILDGDDDGWMIDDEDEELSVLDDTAISLLDKQPKASTSDQPAAQPEPPTMDAMDIDSDSNNATLGPKASDNNPYSWKEFVEHEKAGKEKLMEERDELKKRMTEVEYHLHAVICHLGTSSRAGHYWVWIRDFETGIWYKYNDTTVTQANEAAVLAQLNNSGDAHFLAYVRKDKVKEIVDIRQRRNQSVPQITVDPVAEKDDNDYDDHTAQEKKDDGAFKSAWSESD